MMAGGNVKPQESITRLEALVGLTNGSANLVDFITQIHGVNIKGWAATVKTKKLGADVCQGVFILNAQSIAAADGITDFDLDDDPKRNLHSNPKDRGKEWKKNGKGQAAVDKDKGGKGG
ncbi:hypothetical protein HAX54_048761 [Datura stramonium]|uniref:Uncharacterized protein n=1 Tax=Datura stramonium TaxID=4076 RepID=A0ABS8WM05_DATST|nr:hypothetical protein [Datura stramonium]